MNSQGEKIALKSPDKVPKTIIVSRFVEKIFFKILSNFKFLGLILVKSKISQIKFLMVLIQ